MNEYMEKDPVTWSPSTELFKELYEEVKKNKKIKYVSWAYEGIRFTVKKEDGSKEIVTVKNEEKQEDTLERAKELIIKL